MINFNKKNKNSSLGGYTLVELLFYVALFAVLTLTVINALIIMTKAFKETTIQRELTQGSTILERISREIRKASDITSISATNLKLATADDTGAAKTVEFLLSGTDLQLLENNVLTGNLNGPNISITGLSFSQITTAHSKAVKITVTVRSNNDIQNRNADFYNSVVLRGTY